MQHFIAYAIIALQDISYGKCHAAAAEGAVGNFRSGAA